MYKINVCRFLSGCTHSELALSKQHGEHCHSHNTQSIHPELFVVFGVLHRLLGVCMSSNAARKQEQIKAVLHQVMRQYGEWNSKHQNQRVRHIPEGRF